MHDHLSVLLSFGQISRKFPLASCFFMGSYFNAPFSGYTTCVTQVSAPFCCQVFPLLAYLYFRQRNAFI